MTIGFAPVGAGPTRRRQRSEAPLSGDAARLPPLERARAVLASAVALPSER